MATVTTLSESQPVNIEVETGGPAVRKESRVRKGWNAFDVWQDRIRRAADTARDAQLQGHDRQAAQS